MTEFESYDIGGIPSEKKLCDKFSDKTAYTIVCGLALNVTHRMVAAYHEVLAP